MYRSSRNRFKLDKRGDDEQINNNRFKWGSNSSTPQVKPLLTVKKALRKQNEKVVYCTYYNRDGYCRNGKMISEPLRSPKKKQKPLKPPKALKTPKNPQKFL